MKEDRRYLLDVIEDDINFLNSHSLMDYSLLFCVETNWKKDDILKMASHEVEEKSKRSGSKIDYRKSISEEKRKIKECKLFSLKGLQRSWLTSSGTDTNTSARVASSSTIWLSLTSSRHTTSIKRLSHQ